MSAELSGKRIAVPEARAGDVLADMLERHGAATVRCPLIAIRDVADPAPVAAWLERFIANPPDDLILFTGEGLERLAGFAGRAGRDRDFTAALARVRKFTRGPKPARALRQLGLKPDIAVEPPTTAGIMTTLSGEALAGRRIAVQLYPGNPNAELLDFLGRAGARPDPVLCYVYLSDAEERRVVEVIREMADGRVDLIAFTSTPQVRRLQEVARAQGCEDALRAALQRTAIAAVGPVVAHAVEEAGGRVAVMPQDNFHMRPMVNAILAAFG